MKDNNKEQIIQIMTSVIKPIIKMLQNRMINRIDAMKAFEVHPTDNIPVEIQKMREEEASRVRAVIQEQKDLIDIIQTMYPNA